MPSIKYLPFCLGLNVLDIDLYTAGNSGVLNVAVSIDAISIHSANQIYIKMG